ncbi:2-dehydro-3-deoxygalactonokinase [Oscillospiraceae bacterium MB08-C2-2]|nr:2-dehydro-3-deoxygalactonokinase [Oscillospiraceae bacterium MB08-C2-2]
MAQQTIMTIDSGTTNTRVVLWDLNQQMICMQKKEVGVRDTAINGSNQLLKRGVKECIDGVLEQASIGFDDVKTIIASGMITSNMGLVEIPHVVAPAGMDELAAATKAVLLEDVCPKPIWFIPGIKNNSQPVDMQNYEAMDIMRGEETESVYLIERYHEGKPMVLILPGSHTKLVAVNEQGKITGCMTSISGELLSALSFHTIIADAVGRRFVDEEYSKEMTLYGYQNCKKVGISRASFSARILSQFSGKSANSIANYMLGVSLQEDVAAMKNTDALRLDADSTILIAGKNPLRQALVDVLEYDGYYKNIINYSPEEGKPMSALGASLIAGKCNLL